MKTLRQGIIKRIVVNKHKIRSGDARPISIQTSKGAIPTGALRIEGPSSVIHWPSRPLKCGAKVWVETRAEVNYNE